MTADLAIFKEAEARFGSVAEALRRANAAHDHAQAAASARTGKDVRHHKDALYELMSATTSLSSACRDTLRLIHARPGLNVSDLARKRGVTPSAALNTVKELERRHLIRTEISTERNYERRCYPLEAK